MPARILTLILTSATLLPIAPQPAAPVAVDVFVAGEGGYHTYRIPSIIATRAGTLLAFAEGRRAGAGDAGDIDLVLRRSTDRGATWSAMRVIGDNGPNTFGNPCPLVDRDTGTIWLLTTQNQGGDREKDILAGTSAGSRTVWVMRSGDDGETWSAPIEITASVKDPGWTWYATGPGIAIQARDGRFVVPANHAEAGTGVHRSHLVLSDDHGRSWRLGGSAGEGSNESQVVELADGRLMLNMRNHPPRPENHRLVSISSDGGRTLSQPHEDPALIEPPAQASLVRFTRRPAHDRDRLLFANAASARRERMMVRLSQDEGASWPIGRVVHDGPAAYSSLVVLDDLSIGLLYERGTKSPYELIAFTRFTLDWLSGGRDRLAR